MPCKPGFSYQMSEKVSIFIDGNNFYFGLKKIYGEDSNLNRFNFRKFCDFLAKNRKISKVYYYNAPLDITKDIEKYKSQQRFFDKLSRIPNLKLVLCKLIKRKIKDTEQYYYVLKEDDIHMAVDLVKGAFKNEYDTAILVSGDGDFVPAVKVAQEQSRKVENIYFKKSASANLKYECDKSIRLTKEILEEFFD